MFVVEGATNFCYSKDLYCPLCFVLASLDKASTRTFCPIGICYILTFSKPNFMIFRTWW